MSTTDSLKMVMEPDGRVEIKCNKCDGHLGHIFEPDSGASRTDQRHCVNDSSIQYVKFNAPAGVTEAGKLSLPAGKQY